MKNANVMIGLCPYANDHQQIRQTTSVHNS